MPSARDQAESRSRPKDGHSPAEDDLADALYLQDLVQMAGTPTPKVTGGRAFILTSFALAATLGVAAILAIFVT